MRSPREALAWAKAQVDHPSKNWTGQCASFVHEALDVVNPGYGTATIVYEHAKGVHLLGTPPVGVPVFWTGGSHGYGHVTLSAGGGWCYSNDFKREGQIDLVRISDITKDWGQRYRGWAEYAWDTQIYTKPVPALNYPAVLKAAGEGKPLYYGKLLKHALAAEVGWGLMVPTKTLGPAFRRRWRRLQAKLHGGLPKHYSGLPSQADLAWLGKRHGFTVN